MKIKLKSKFILNLKKKTCYMIITIKKQKFS